MQLSQLRVVFLSDAIPDRNGVGVYYEDLIAHLSRHTAMMERIAPGIDNDAGLTWFSFGIPGDPTQKLSMPRRSALRRRIAELSPDVLVFPTLGPYTVMGVWIAQKLGIPYCAAHHTDFEHLADMYWSGSWWQRGQGAALKRIVQWATRLVAERSVATVANSRTAAEAARRSGCRNVRLVGTPLSPDLLSRPVQLPRRQLQRLLFVGRLAPEKNVPVILEAARALPEFQFAIAGDGPLRPQVVHAAATRANVDYLGWVPRPKLPELLDDNDLLLLPSSVETFGTVALEALARMRPVLASPHCGIAEWSGLAESIYVLDSNLSLAENIRRVSQLDYSSRCFLARSGCEAARSLCRDTVDTWLQVLLDTAGLRNESEIAAVRHAS